MNMKAIGKKNPTGFVGSMLLSPNQHGYQTIMLVYKWVKDDVEPPKTTYVRNGILITRKNFKQVLKEQGLTD